MKTTRRAASAFAQNGWYFGSLSSSPLTLPPMAAPRRPYFFTPSSSCSAARSGMLQRHGCERDEAIGCAAHASASFSFCSWMICSREVASALYQYGLMLERFDVDPLLVHRAQPLGYVRDHAQVGARRRSPACRA
jgi:hypothetical protein